MRYRLASLSPSRHRDDRRAIADYRHWGDRKSSEPHHSPQRRMDFHLRLRRRGPHLELLESAGLFRLAAAAPESGALGTRGSRIVAIGRGRPNCRPFSSCCGRIVAIGCGSPRCGPLSSGGGRVLAIGRCSTRGSPFSAGCGWLIPICSRCRPFRTRCPWFITRGGVRSGGGACPVYCFGTLVPLFALVIVVLRRRRLFSRSV